MAAETQECASQGGHPSMRTIGLVDAREVLLSPGPEGAKGGETKRDEVEAVGPASASMLVPLTLLNRCKIISSVSPTTACK